MRPTLLTLMIACSRPSAREVESDFIERDSAPRLRVHAVGDAGAPTVVLVHGGPGSGSAHLIEVAEALAASGYRAVTYDQRGSGESDPPSDATDYGFDAYVRDLDDVRAWAGADSVHLVGHSWGGIVAAAYASTHPEHTSNTALVGSGALSRKTERRVDDAIRARERALYEADLVPQVPPEVPDECAKHWGTYVAFYVDPAAMDPAHLPSSCSEAAKKATWRAVGDYSFVGRMPEVDGPVLVAYGTHDPLTVALPELMDAIPLTYQHVAWFRRCGHRPMYECPDQFYPVLTEFLERGP